jgi:hypothetical protein
MGVADDVDVIASAMTFRDQVLALRKATEAVQFKTQTLSWSPLDRDKWYYVSSETATSDERFLSPGSLNVICAGPAPATLVGYIDMVYHIEFAGATKVPV